MASALPSPNENEVGISLRQAADIARRRMLALLDRCEKLRGGDDEGSTGSWVEWMPALVGDPWVCSAGATTVERSAAVVAQVLYSLDAAALLDPRCLGVGEITSVEDGRHMRHAIRNYRFRCVCWRRVKSSEARHRLICSWQLAHAVCRKRLLPRRLLDGAPAITNQGRGRADDGSWARSPGHSTHDFCHFN
jgi:hypothetical protein